MIRHAKAFLAILAAILVVVSVYRMHALTPQQKNIILATTTSTQASGLLDALIPIFQKKTGYFVKTIAVGPSQSIALGQRGEADVLLVHSPNAEKKLVADSYGINRRIVMHSDFIIIGPPEDPARIRGLKSGADAFRRIAGTGSLFVARSDGSGTEAKEKAIWKAAGISPEGQKWYEQTGLGIGRTLNVASEKRAYTLTDRGTYLASKKKLGLDIFTEGDPILLNIYHVMEINPAKWPKVNAGGAKAFADFIVSPEAQDVIKTFGVDKFGSPQFYPDAGKMDEDLGKK